MVFLWTEPFKRDFGRLPDEVQGRVQKVLDFFALSSRHPSLHAKRMEGYSDIWELRVSDNYRITFQFVREGALLRRIGTHHVLHQP